MEIRDVRESTIDRPWHNSIRRRVGAARDPFQNTTGREPNKVLYCHKMSNLSTNVISGMNGCRSDGGRMALCQLGSVLN